MDSFGELHFLDLPFNLQCYSNVSIWLMYRFIVVTMFLFCSPKREKYS